MRFYDAVTGVPNRALFIDRLGQAVARLKRPGETVAVMALGIDGLDALESEVGSIARDELLRSVTLQFQEELRGGDTVARLGDSEFGLIVEHLHSHDQIPIVAKRIVAGLAAFEKQNGMLSARLGVAAVEHGHSADGLLDHALTALEKARQSDGGGWEMYEPDANASEGSGDVTAPDLVDAR